MLVNPDCIQSINENLTEMSGAWCWTSVDTYAPRYTEILQNPISLEAVTINYFHFKEPICTITIRETPDPNSTLLWTGISYNIEDDGNATNGTSTPDTINYSTGVVGNIAPSATYGSGTITIADTYVNLCSDAFFETPIKTYWVNGGTFTLIDGTEQYLVIDYNNGTPIYRIENNKLIVNKSSIILVRICWRQGNNVHSIDSDCQGLGLANKIESAIINTTPYRKSTDGGLILSETATPTNRTVLITGAVVYSGSTPHQILAFNSSINQFTFVRHVAGVWTYSDVSVYNNSQYDNGTDLVSLTTNKYTVNWIYRSIGNSIQSFFVLGNDEYSTVAHAQASTAINVPFLLRDHCMLVGRIIVKQGATSGVVENVADTTFTGATVTGTTNHNDLAGLQGNGPEYYHFTGAQYTDLTDGLDSSLHYHSSDRNRANHTGTQLSSTISDFTSAVDNRITVQKGAANGICPLDSGAKVSTTYLPDAILGAMRYQGTWNASTNTPTLPTPAAANKGYYWIVSVSGTYSSIDFQIGDWAVSNGSGTIAKVDNTDSISSWNGRTGAILPIYSDYSSFYVSLSGSYSNPTWITSLDPAKITQTASYRFVTDTEKATWNGKQAGSAVLTSIATLSSGTGLVKLTNGTASLLDTNAYLTSAGTINNVLVTQNNTSNTLYPLVWDNGSNQLFHTAEKFKINPNTGWAYFPVVAVTSSFRADSNTAKNDTIGAGAYYGVSDNTTYAHFWQMLANGNLALFSTTNNGTSYIKPLTVDPSTGDIYTKRWVYSNAGGNTVPSFIGDWNSAYTWGICGGNGTLNDNTIAFRTLDANHTPNGYANIAAGKGKFGSEASIETFAAGSWSWYGYTGYNNPINWSGFMQNLSGQIIVGAVTGQTVGLYVGQTAKLLAYNNLVSISTSLAVNGASMPAWGTGLNPIMLGGEAFLYSYKSANGTQPTWGSNFYYDGTNLKTIATYTNSNYPRALLIEVNGTLNYLASNVSPTAGATITDLNSKFSVDKTGVGTFAGSVTAGKAYMGTYYNDVNGAFFGLAGANASPWNGLLFAYGHTYITSPNDIYFSTNTAGKVARFDLPVVCNNNITPGAVATYDLGSVAAPWYNVRANFFTENGTLLVDKYQALGTCGLLSGTNMWSGSNSFSANTKFYNASFTTNALGAGGTGAAAGPYTGDTSYGWFGAVGLNGPTWARILVGYNGNVQIAALGGSNNLLLGTVGNTNTVTISDAGIAFSKPFIGTTTISGSLNVDGSTSLGVNTPSNSSAYTIQGSDMGKVVILTAQLNRLPVSGLSAGFWCILSVAGVANIFTVGDVQFYYRGVYVATSQNVRGCVVAVWNGNVWTVG